MLNKKNIAKFLNPIDFNCISKCDSEKFHLSIDNKCLLGI